MAKIELPNFDEKQVVSAETFKSEVDKPKPTDETGVPMSGELDPILISAVESQPQVKTDKDEAEIAHSLRAATPTESFSSPSPRIRALGSVLAAGALAIAGMALSLTLRRSKVNGAAGAASIARGPEIKHGGEFFGEDERLAKLFGFK